MTPIDNDLIPFIIEKIAMSGSKGIISDDLWTCVETKFSPLYTTTKESIWQSIKQDSTIDLCIKTDNSSVIEPLSGSYKELSYQQIIENYNTDIYWIASTEKQDQFLLNDIKITLPPLQRTILEKIGYAGPIGLAQCVITQDLKIKPQTASHNLKKLQDHDLITKHPSIYRGVYTNTCIHKRYVNDTHIVDDVNGNNNNDNDNDELNPIDADGSIRHDITAKKMTQLLLQAKDNMMTLIDLIRLTGFTTTKHTKWARTFITKQHGDGNVEKVLNTANGKRTMCVKLIKPLSTQSNKEKSTLKQIEKSSQTQSNQRQQLTTDMINLYIENTKEKGCTNKDLFHAFSGHTHANIREVVKKCINNATITSIKELQGRSHVYRYFSKVGFEQYLTLMNLPNDTQTNMLNNIEKNNSNEKMDVDDEIVDKNDNDDKIPTTTTNIIPSTSLKNSINITSEYRKKSLLTIIQRDKIREFNQQLIDEIKSMDKSENANRLDRKTIQRLIDRLIKQKDISSIRTMSKTFIGRSSSQSKILLLASDLENSDQLVKEYLDKQQFNDILPDHRRIPNKSSLKEIEITVERYDSNHHQHRYNIETSEYFWRYVAKRHGWMDSKWLRAKELHIYLYHLLLKDKIDHETIIKPDDQRQISLANIINMLPFDLFCKIIGIQLHDNTIESFIENTKNNNPFMPLYQLPHEVKIKLIPNASRMRRRIQTLLLILKQLELIEKIKINHHHHSETTTISSSSSSSSSVKSNEYGYEIKLIGHIKNYKLPERPILMEKPLTTIQQVMDFWNELQYTCTCICSTISEEFGNNKNKSTNTNDLLSSITLTKTWVNGNILTKEQKQQLDQYVNYEKGEVPKKDWQLFLQLSRHTGLLPYRIRSYYINLGIAFDKRHNKEKNQLSITPTLNFDSNNINNDNNDNNHDDGDGDDDKHFSSKLIIGNSKKRKREMDDTVQILLEASKKKQRVIHIPDHLRKNTMVFSKETGVGSRPLRKKPIGNIDEPFVTRDIENNQPKEANQQQFTESEHSIFIHATAIMQHRAQHGTFYWAPIITVLPEKSISQCQSYLQSLKAKSSPSIHEITELKYKWDLIYKQGIKNKNLIDERPWDTKKFNLPSYLEYFVSHLLNYNDDERINPCMHLKKRIPFHSNDIHNLFHVIYKLSTSSIVKKKYQPYIVPWTQNMIHLPMENQNQYKFEDLDIATTIHLIKMIMIEPSETYDPHVAYNLLSQCSEINIEKAFKYLRDIGTLVLSKHGDSRYIPGRQFRMSNAFISALAGPLPVELYDTAYHFHKQIKNNQMFSQPLKNGDMAALLNLISERKITLKNTKYEKIIKRRSHIKYDILYHNKLIKIWNNDNHKDLYIQIEDPEVQMKSPFYSRKLERFSKLTSDQIKQLLNDYDKQHLKATIVYNTLYQYDEQGATLMELKIKLQNDKINITDDILIDTFNTLINKNPPLVTYGGHDVMKYICIEHVATNFFLKCVTPKPPSSSSKNIINKQDKSYLKASMWCMFDGKTNQNMLYICATTLLGYIVQQPGITNEKLFDIHKNIMSYVEFQQILDHLLKNDNIISRSRMKESKPSLFSKPLLKFIDLNENITCNTVTHYWANKDYYVVNVIKQ